jgi:hypothetical protein
MFTLREDDGDAEPFAPFSPNGHASRNGNGPH